VLQGVTAAIDEEYTALEGAVKDVGVFYESLDSQREWVGGKREPPQRLCRHKCTRSPQSDPTPFSPFPSRLPLPLSARAGAHVCAGGQAGGAGGRP
jgi:hypothetical protein